MTPVSLGIPWAEKWPAIRVCRSVAIRTLPVVTGGGCRATEIEPFASCSVLPIRGPSVVPPNPPDGRSRTKAPAACWGFRLVIIPTRHQAASSTRQTLARPMPIALAILVAPEALGLHLARLDHQPL